MKALDVFQRESEQYGYWEGDRPADAMNEARARVVRLHDTEVQFLRSAKARGELMLDIAADLCDADERQGTDWDYEHPVHDKINELRGRSERAESSLARLQAEGASLKAALEELVRLDKRENESAGLFRPHPIAWGAAWGNARDIIARTAPAQEEQ